ncbi:hypothetical protein NQ318_004297 [Aromia moschata]|uniref:Uncharacterized protein n=1 Tax=Aromia moschata TaxID=1265417 RepID=A0AAV8YRH0_9CUCU|nr:hypothetical protein NQ318_004297 [Aromia moschata]
MADSADNYSDLAELGIDCDDSLTEVFNRAADHLQGLLPGVDNQTLLILYGARRARDQEVVPEAEKTLTDRIKEGAVADVREFLRRNAASKASINRTDKDGLAPIHWAADSGFSDVIGVLLEAGADVNLQDADGQTALHYAASCGHAECVEFLLQRGGKGDIVDSDNNTPMSVASDDSVKKLFDS